MTKKEEKISFCFFFSSRRRHTRCSRDWSSDVCSSDLELAGGIIGITEILPIGALLARTSKTALKDYALRDRKSVV